MGFKLHCCPGSRLARAAEGGGRSLKAVLTSPPLYMEWPAIAGSAEGRGQGKELVVSSVHRVCWSLFSDPNAAARGGAPGGDT